LQRYISEQEFFAHVRLSLTRSWSVARLVRCRLLTLCCLVSWRTDSATGSCVRLLRARHAVSNLSSRE